MAQSKRAGWGQWLLLAGLIPGCAADNEVTIGADGKVSDGARPEGEQVAETTAPLTAKLTRASSCPDVATRVRTKYRQEIEADYERDKSQFATGGTPTCPKLPLWMSTGATTGAGAQSPTGNSPSPVSATNNQVVGVDEADLVKTDGSFIYLAQGSELRIVKAWPAAQAEIASRVDLGGSAKKLFVEKDRLVVYVAKGTSNATDCTYGYGCESLSIPVP